MLLKITAAADAAAETASNEGGSEEGDNAVALARGSSQERRQKKCITKRSEQKIS